MNIQMVEDDVDGLLEPRRRDKNKRLQHSVKKKLIDYFEILQLVSPHHPPPNPTLCTLDSNIQSFLVFNDAMVLFVKKINTMRLRNNDVSYCYDFSWFSRKLQKNLPDEKGKRCGLSSQLPQPLSNDVTVDSPVEMKDASTNLKWCWFLCLMCFVIFCQIFV